MNQPLTQQPASPRQQTQQGLVFNAEQFSYSPLLTFTSTSSPTESTVASSPQISMDPNYHAFFPPSPNGQCAAAAAFSSTLNNIESPPQERKPLVFIRLDPTNDLYKLYPMSTIAIIPWLYSSVPQMNEQEAIQQQLSNLNVVGLSSSPSETNAGSIPFVSRSDFGNSLYSHHYQMKDEKHDSVDPGPSGSSGWMWTRVIGIIRYLFSPSHLLCGGGGRNLPERNFPDCNHILATSSYWTIFFFFLSYTLECGRLFFLFFYYFYFYFFFFLVFGWKGGLMGILFFVFFSMLFMIPSCLLHPEWWCADGWYSCNSYMCMYTYVCTL